MRPFLHVISAVGLALAVQNATQQPLWAGIAACGSLAPDLDHLIEAFWQCQGPWSWRRFFAPGHAATWDKIHFLCHGHEWAVLLFGLTWLTGWPELGWFALGYWLHLLLDETGNRLPDKHHRIHPLFYFLIFRWWHGFQVQKISRFRPV